MVIDEFSRSDITAEVCGTVTKGSLFEIELDDQRQILFDFDKDTLGCAAPQKL
jgi:selenophosphate synthetase-related protein